VAFEPHPGINRMLRTTVKMNKLGNISVFQTALSNTEGEIVIPAKRGKTRKVGECRIPVRTLDSFKLKPSLLKIDTEGNELLVLQGAMETLKQRPRIVVETHSFSESSRYVRSYLEARGYSIREFRRRNRFNQIQSWLLCN
jgi:FkbM family methyltransferase